MSSDSGCWRTVARTRRSEATGIGLTLETPIGAPRFSLTQPPRPSAPELAAAQHGSRGRLLAGDLLQRLHRVVPHAADGAMGERTEFLLILLRSQFGRVVHVPRDAERALAVAERGERVHRRRPNRGMRRSNLEAEERQRFRVLQPDER